MTSSRYTRIGYTHLPEGTEELRMHANMHMFVYACVHMCIYLSVYTFIYVCVYIFIYQSMTNVIKKFNKASHKEKIFANAAFMKNVKFPT